MFKHYEIGLMMTFGGTCCDLCRFWSRKSRNMIEKELTCVFFVVVTCDYPCRVTCDVL